MRVERRNRISVFTIDHEGIRTNRCTHGTSSHQHVIVSVSVLLGVSIARRR